MGRNSFRAVATTEASPNWDALIQRPSQLYSRQDDIRTPFARDYTRILHSKAYRRLKHKTQVFFNIGNDHICTRMEHVAHVESVSSTIAKYLGLNDELTKAIAIGHDLGHAPFGHQGEVVLNRLSNKYLKKPFWHEKNGLRFVDQIELLEDNYKVFRNLDLTYAVRDGIISHCGEVDENGLHPREDLFDLEHYQFAGQFAPATWEGCIVKLSDKIAYIGRDIEDATNLGFLDDAAQHKLLQLARANDQNVLNTTVIMHNLVIDICQNSSPEKGICLSNKFLAQLNEVKEFNYKYIYKHKRLEPFVHYSDLVLTQIFNALLGTYDGKHSWDSLGRIGFYLPTLVPSFQMWLARYCDPEILPEGDWKQLALRCENRKIYGQLENKKIYIQAILDYISGMTDQFAIKVFQEMLSY